MSRSLLRCSMAGLLLTSLMALPASAQKTLLVHLPSTPIEAANQLAEAVTELALEVSTTVPELLLEPRIFRRWSDAQAAWAGDLEGIDLLLTDAAFLADPELAAAFEISHHWSRGGASTSRRLLVVRRDREGLTRLADLRGQRLAVAETSGPATARFLADRVFDGALDPADWFGEIALEVDDFTAVAAVLFGNADAALVAEHNPLLTSQLDGDLRAVYTSPPLSLPVLAVRRGALEAPQRAGLDAALAGLGQSARGQRVLATLELDGLSPATRTAPPAVAAKRLAIAAAPGGVLTLEPPSPPAAADLPLTLAVELPDVPLAGFDALDQ